jgi:predicted dehydrogenase
MPDLYGTGDCSVHLRRAWRELPAGIWTTVPTPPADPFRATVDAFAAAVRDHRPAPVGAADAAAALGVVLDLYATASQPVAGRTE